MKEFGAADLHEVAGSTIGRRILISRFADESARCSGFEA